MTGPLPTLIELGDIEARLGSSLAESEVSQVESLISFAVAKLRAPNHGLNIDLRVLEGTLDIALIRGVLVTAVCRAFDALRVGPRVRSEQYPEISTTYADSDESLVYFTDDELGSLAEESVGLSGGAFSIRIG